MFKYVTSYKRESCKSQVSLREIGNSYSYRNSLKFQRSSNLFIRLKGSYFKNQICILRLLSRDSGGRIITISGAHLCTPPPPICKSYQFISLQFFAALLLPSSQFLSVQPLLDCYHCSPKLFLFIYALHFCRNPNIAHMSHVFAVPHWRF